METKPIPSAEDSINPPLPSVEWKETQELGYDGPHSKQLPVCFHCGKADINLLKCAKCNVAAYCSREHQIADWKHTPGHKLSCQSE
jgi:MYND finger